jgi:mono/diheme cytochrome c family protein
MRTMALATLVGVLATACLGRPAEDATGEEIYLQVCSNCHGEALEGALGPALGPGSNAAAQPDDFLRLTITEGRGRMPSFSSSLTSTQIDRLIGYIREEQRG